MTQTERTEAAIAAADGVEWKTGEMWQEVELLRDHARDLARKLDAVFEEIRDYPPPPDWGTHYSCELAQRIRAIVEATP